MNKIVSCIAVALMAFLLAATPSFAQSIKSDQSNVDSVQQTNRPRLTAYSLSGTIWESRTEIGEAVVTSTFQFLSGSQVAVSMITTNTQTFLKRENREIDNYVIVDNENIKVSLSEGVQSFHLALSAADYYLMSSDGKSDLIWSNDNSWQTDFSHSTPVSNEEIEMIRQTKSDKAYIVGEWPGDSMFQDDIKNGYVMKYTSFVADPIIIKPLRVVSSNELILKPYGNDGFIAVSEGKAIVFIFFQFPDGEKYVYRRNIKCVGKLGTPKIYSNNTLVHSIELKSLPPQFADQFRHAKEVELPDRIIVKGETQRYYETVKEAVSKLHPDDELEFVGVFPENTSIVKPYEQYMNKSRPYTARSLYGISPGTTTAYYLFKSFISEEYTRVKEKVICCTEQQKADAEKQAADMAKKLKPLWYIGIKQEKSISNAEEINKEMKTLHSTMKANAENNRLYDGVTFDYATDVNGVYAIKIIVPENKLVRSFSKKELAEGAEDILGGIVSMLPQGRDLDVSIVYRVDKVWDSGDRSEGFYMDKYYTKLVADVLIKKGINKKRILPERKFLSSGDAGWTENRQFCIFLSAPQSLYRLSVSPDIVKNGRLNQNQIDWIAKELGVSSAVLVKKINESKDGRIKIDGRYWNLDFLASESLKNTEKGK